jgi:phosphorylcholine metabolism protein LicD
MKFFHEHSKYPHLDKRFYNPRFDYKIHNKKILRGLLQVLSRLCKENTIRCTIMHGSLIGYYFGKQMLPWDDDIDVIIVEDDLPEFLKIKHNDKFHILEINPNSRNRSPHDRQNVIDARLICKKTGIFIDITFLTYNRVRKGLMNCKSPHYYAIRDILPLKQIEFEGCNVYVPNNIKTVLTSEYGQKVLIPRFKNWVFSNDRGWNKICLYLRK